MGDMDETGTIDIGILNRRARPRSVGAETTNLLSAAADALRDEVEREVADWRKAGLSDEEAIVAAYLGLGFTNRAISHIIARSPTVVNDHQRRIEKRYKEAKRLVTAVESPGVRDILSRYWTCPQCGHDNKLSQIPVTREVETGRTQLRCFGCREWTNVQDSPRQA